MANSITRAAKYTNFLDTVYSIMAKTSIFDAPAEFVKAGATAGSVLIPNISMQGLGDYSRSTGFVSGDVTFAWETFTLTQERGRKFTVDRMDNQETEDMAFGKLGSEFMRVKVAPEVDAYRMATIAGKAGTIATPATPTVSNIDTLIDAGIVVMDEAEVPAEDRVLVITPTMYNLLTNSSSWTKNVDVQNNNGVIDKTIRVYKGMPVVQIPQTRMYTKITTLDGSTSGEEAGGYTITATTGKLINFCIVSKSAVLGVKKHAKARMWSADENQTIDANQLDYRIYHDLFVPAKKTKGIYLHNQA